MADCAICSGVTGTAGLRPGVSAEPVTAHEIMTLRCMSASLATDVEVKPTARVGLKPRGSLAQERSIEASNRFCADVARAPDARLRDDVQMTRNRARGASARNLSPHMPAQAGDPSTWRAFAARWLASHCAL